MGSCVRFVLLWVVASCFFAAGARAQAVHAPPAAGATVPFAKIPRVTHPPTLGDFLRNQPREAELTVTDFRQYVPGDGTPASEPTTAYLSYDAKNLYVVFVCRDEPGRVRAHLSKREDLSQDDGVGIYLDTFRDRRRAYYFFSNPLGIQLDAIYTETQGKDTSFDTLWYTEGRLTPDGYIVWFAIPFKSLRFSDAPQQTWGVALYRSILRNSEEDYWPYITQRVQGLAQQFSPVTGLERVSPGRNLQFIPYGMLASNHFLNQPSPVNPATPPFYDDVFEHRAGLDAKFVVKDALTFDATLNPDFSQVESDDPQVTVNQRFAVFFPEKRPFFIENAGFFQTPVNLFFSRRIADPQFGGRMTGKAGGWTLGALVIDDRQPGQGQPAGSPYDTRAVDGVVRVSREFGKQSYVGAFASSRDFADTNNRVVSLDGRFKLSPNWVADFQATHSWTRQDENLPQLCQQFNAPAPSANASSQQGNSLYADLSYTGRHFLMSSYYADYSPGFCAELGFIPRVDIRQEYAAAAYLWRPNKWKIVDIGPSASELLDWDHNGVLQDWQAIVAFQADLTRQTTLSVSRGEAYELFANIPFRKHSTSYVFNSAPYRWLSFNSRFIAGVNENFFPAAPLAPFLANVKRFNLGFTLRPSARFRFDQTYLYYRLGTREGSTPPGFTPGHPIFNNHLLRSKLNYQFTRELSLRLILDYDATLANAQLLDLQSNLGSFDGGPIAPPKKFTTDVLFTYLLHPGTALYVGYTDSLSNLRLDRSFVPPQVVYQSAPTETNSRLFFVKLSYLFRF